jgi:hypothetical protein
MVVKDKPIKLNEKNKSNDDDTNDVFKFYSIN